jgi:hypothetical protein
MSKVMAGMLGPLAGNSRAVALDGNGYIDVGRHDEFALVHEFTVEAWVCIADISSQSAARIIAATPGAYSMTAGRTHGWSLEVSRKAESKGVLPPAILRFTTYGVKDYEFALPNEMAAQDRWVHVVIVCDRNSTAHFYLDGKLRNSVTANNPANHGSVWIEIGGSTIRTDEFWSGRLAHLGVYPRALGPQQIENHFNQRRTP